MKKHRDDRSGNVTQEEWRDIPGFEGMFQVSSMGRVKSLDRIVGGAGGRTRVFPGSMRSFGRAGAGYRNVTLGKNGRRRTFRLHRLVLSVFVGPCPEGFQGSHLNGDPGDNRLCNLKWESARDNHMRQWDHGTRPSVLTREDVIEIRARRAAGEPFRTIFPDYSAAESTITQAASGHTWSHNRH